MQSKPSHAEDWYRDFEQEQNQAAYLKSLVNSTPPTSEEEWLDFKVGNVKGDKLNDNDTKRIWSKALSGFANTGQTRGQGAKLINLSPVCHWLESTTAGCRSYFCHPHVVNRDWSS